MRIMIDKVVLCEGDISGQYPEGLSIDGSRKIQIAEFLRATEAEPIGRGNRLRRISFSVTREHADHYTAMIWALDHESELPENGIVSFEFQGGGNKTLYLHHGQLETHRVSPIIGCSTIHSYNLVGSKFDKEKPV